MFIAFLLVGLLFFAAGVFIIWQEYQSRLGTTPVRGKIVGYSTGRITKQNTPYYHTVVEFKAHDQRARLIESSVGSSSPLGKIGEERFVLVNSNNFDQAVLLSPLSYILGFVMASLGFVGLFVSYATFDTSLFSVITAVMVIGSLLLSAIKAQRKIPLSMEQWNEKKKSLKGKVLPAENKNEINWADHTSLVVAHNRHKKASRFAIPILAVLTGGCFVGSYYAHQNTSKFMSVAQSTSGRVVALKESHSSDSTTYAPIVEFHLGTGEPPIRFRHSISSSPPSYRVGESVKVLFNPANPNEARIDLGPWNFIVSQGAAGFGILCLLMLIHSFRSRPRSYDDVHPTTYSQSA